MASRLNVAGVLLAGAHAWDQKSMEAVTPRSLMPLAGSCALTYNVAWFQAAGVCDIAISVNGDTRAHRDELRGQFPGMQLHYYEDLVPRGPGGAARDAGLAREHETIVVANAAGILTVPLDQLLEHHHSHASDVTVVLANEAPAGNATGQLRAAGVYIFERDALRAIPDMGFQDLKEGLLPRLRAANFRITPMRVASPVFRLTSMNAYRVAHAYMLDRLLMDARPVGAYQRVGEALIHTTAEVASSAQFVGPTLIHAGVAIEDGAIIVGPTEIGAHTVVGADTMVARSMIWRACSVGGGASLDWCVVTDGAEIRPRTAHQNVLLMGCSERALQVTRAREAGGEVEPTGVETASQSQAPAI